MPGNHYGQDGSLTFGVDFTVLARCCRHLRKTCAQFSSLYMGNYKEGGFLLVRRLLKTTRSKNVIKNRVSFGHQKHQKPDVVSDSGALVHHLRPGPQSATPHPWSLQNLLPCPQALQEHPEVSKRPLSYFWFLLENQKYFRKL